MKPSCSVSRDTGITFDGGAALTRKHCPHSNFAHNLFASPCDSRRPSPRKVA
jgi:hypothetical protein